MNSNMVTQRLSIAPVFMIFSTCIAFGQANTVSLQGAFDGRYTGTVQGTTLQATGGGAGTSSYIGPFTYSEKATVDLITGLSNGTFRLVAANGDQLNGSFVGRALPDIPKGSHFIGLVTITDGTGRFQGATGGLTLDRFFDDTNVPAYNLAYGTLTGTITTPAPTRAATTASAEPKNATVILRELRLDGTGSVSRDGKPLAYNWSIPPGSPSAAISHAETATPLVQFGRQRGLYRFRLKVTDSSGGSATDFVAINFQGN